MAIVAVAYLRVIDTDGQCHASFIMGKAKLAPSTAHTVPRLELCAAVLAVELTEMVTKESDIDLHRVTFYTDSRIVLGYIQHSSILRVCGKQSDQDQEVLNTRPVVSCQH